MEPWRVDRLVKYGRSRNQSGRDKSLTRRWDQELYRQGKETCWKGLVNKRSVFNGLSKGVNINGLGGEGAKQRFEDELETDKPRDSRSERAEPGKIC